jgi:LPXTG-motif cell wall-anchored protein
VELTNHEDIQAESQTVKLTEVPTEPEKPADTPDAPKTGDTTNLWIPVAVLVAAFAGIVAVIIRIRRKKF